MNKNAKPARAIAIAKVKEDPKLVAVRYLMLAIGATAALLAVVLASLS